MAIKLVVTDLDRTLLRDDGSISDATREVFARVKAAGVKCVIATGRSAVEAEYSIKATGADEFIINYTGARVSDLKNGEVVYERFLDEEMVIRILDKLRGYAGIFCIVYASGRTLVLPGSFENTAHFTKNKEFFDAARSQLAFEGDPVEYIRRTHIKVNKVFFMNLPIEQIEELEIWLNGLGGLDIMRTMPLGLDIVSEGVNKGRAVTALARYLGFRDDEVMILGDSDNDEAMFDGGFFKVAMENASPAILAKCDCVTKSNNDEGVAYALRKYVLKEEGLS